MYMFMIYYQNAAIFCDVKSCGYILPFSMDLAVDQVVREKLVQVKFFVEERFKEVEGMKTVLEELKKIPQVEVMYYLHPVNPGDSEDSYNIIPLLMNQDVLLTKVKLHISYMYLSFPDLFFEKLAEAPYLKEIAVDVTSAEYGSEFVRKLNNSSHNVNKLEVAVEFLSTEIDNLRSDLSELSRSQKMNINFLGGPLPKTYQGNHMFVIKSEGREININTVYL